MSKKREGKGRRNNEDKRIFNVCYSQVSHVFRTNLFGFSGIAKAPLSDFRSLKCGKME